MRAKLSSALAGFALVISAVVVAPAESAVAAADFRPAKEDGVPDAYLVVLKDDEQGEAGGHLTDKDLADEAERAKVDRTVAELLSRHNGKLQFTYYDVLRGFSVLTSAEAAVELAAEPVVDFVEQQRVLHYQDEQIDPPWNLDMLDDRSRDMSYRYGTTGAGVHAYIIDSGIRSTHVDFGGRVVEQRAFLPPGTATGGVADCVGHGTSMAGIVGGSRYGVAKQVHLHDLRIGGCDVAITGNFVAAADWLVRHVQRPAVVNLSAATGVTESLDRAARRIVAWGITFVTVATNADVDACRRSPSRVPEAITVGSWEPFRERVPTTGWGECLDLFAPGTAILTAGNDNDRASVWSGGTSAASAHVTGAVARFLELHSDATPAQMATTLQDEATKDRLTNPKRSPNLTLYLDEAGPGNDGFGHTRGSDFNGDGRDDIVTFTRGGSPGVWVALSTGTSFGPVQHWHPRFAAGNEIPMLGDFNGDGRDDIVTFTRGSAADVYVALSDGTQFVGTGDRWHARFAVGNETPAVGDFNGDGRDDIVTFTRGSAADAYVALSDGNQFVGTGVRWSSDVASGTSVPLIGDFTCDGRDDVLAVERLGYSVAHVSPSLGSRFGPPERWRAPWLTGLQTPVVGDFNGDGCDDLAMLDRADYADVEVLLSTGSAFEAPTRWHSGFSAGTAVPGAGDFNGDGRDDLVSFIRGDGGEVHVIPSTGTRFGGVNEWLALFAYPFEVPMPAVLWP